MTSLVVSSLWTCIIGLPPGSQLHRRWKISKESITSRFLRPPPCSFSSRPPKPLGLSTNSDYPTPRHSGFYIEYLASLLSTLTMILRFQSREGQFRLNVEPTTDISTILPDVLEKLPKDIVPSTITISPKPHGADSRPIQALKGVTFGRLGLT